MNRAPTKQVLAALVLSAVLFGCGGSSRDYRANDSQLGQEPKLVSIEGRLRLAKSDNVTFPNYKYEGLKCYGMGGYEDIREGLQVVVRNASSVIVGTGQLRPQSGADADYRECRFVWNINKIAESDFYSVEVGKRGALIFSLRELQGSNFVVEATLGE